MRQQRSNHDTSSPTYLKSSSRFIIIASRREARFDHALSARRCHKASVARYYRNAVNVSRNDFASWPKNDRGRYGMVFAWLGLDGRHGSAKSDCEETSSVELVYEAQAPILLRPI